MNMNTKDTLVVRILEAKYQRPLVATRTTKQDGTLKYVQAQVPADMALRVQAAAAALSMSMNEVVTLALADFLATAQKAMEEHGLADKYTTEATALMLGSRVTAPKTAKAPKTARPAAHRALPDEDTVRQWHDTNGLKIDKTAKHFGITWHRAKAIVTNRAAVEPKTEEKAPAQTTTTAATTE